LQEERRKIDLEKVIERQERILKRLYFIMSKKVVREILVVIGLYVSIALITGSVLSALSDRSFDDALFESASAISTTGLTAGVTSVNLDSFSKIMLTGNMLVGRFEIIAILYIFFNYFRK
jgi:trk system potassium uptake protein